MVASMSSSLVTTPTCSSSMGAELLVRILCLLVTSFQCSSFFLAYDLKLVMNKDVCDIIRPQWILDCVAQGEIVPLTKKYVPRDNFRPLSYRFLRCTRYFFHATTARKETQEYSAEDSDTEEEPEEPEPSIYAASTSKSKSETPEEERITPRNKDEESQIDPSMAEWFDVGKDRSATSSTLASETESETEPEPDEPEPDSDNDDSRGEEAETGFDDDDWEQVEKETGSQSQEASDLVSTHATSTFTTLIWSPHSLRTRARSRPRTKMFAWVKMTAQCIMTRSTSSSTCELCCCSRIIPRSDTDHHTQVLLPRLSQQC